MSKLTKKRVHWYEVNEDTGNVIADEDVDVLTSADATYFDDGETLQHKYDNGVIAKGSDVGRINELTTTNKSSLVDSVNEVVTSAANNKSSLSLHTANKNNPHNVTASQTPIDNSISGLNANDVQGAIDELKGTIGYTSKNLLTYPYHNNSSRQDDGLSWTLNNDGSVTANGQPLYECWFVLAHRTESPISLNAGAYILNGCPKDGSEQTYHMFVCRTAPDGSLDIIAYDCGDGARFILEETTNVGVSIHTLSGAELPNITFKPMIRQASIVDDAYESYKASVQTQLDSKADKRNLQLMEISGSNQNNAPHINLKEKWSQIPVGFTFIEILAGSRCGCLVWKMSEQYGEAILLGYMDGNPITIVNVTPGKWTYSRTTTTTSTEF